MSKAPVENHRVILNTIHELREDIRKREVYNGSIEAARYAVTALGMMIKRMKIEKDHARVLREWRRLCEEIWPSSEGPGRGVKRWGWVDKSIEAQK